MFWDLEGRGSRRGGRRDEGHRQTDLLGPRGPLLGLYFLLNGEDFERKGDLSL